LHVALQPVAETVTKPVFKTVAKPAAEPVAEPVAAESVPETVAEPVAEEVIEPSSDLDESSCSSIISYHSPDLSKFLSVRSAEIDNDDADDDDRQRVSSTSNKKAGHRVWETFLLFILRNCGLSIT